MKHKVVCTVVVSLFLLSAVLMPTIQKVKAEDTTALHVDPSKSCAPVGELFSINVSISNVTNLYTWRFDLEWDANLLEVPDDPGTPGIVEGVSEGPFLNKEGEFQTTLTSRLFSNRISATCALKGVESSDAPSGSGTLATITFLSKAEGECALHFSFTRLLVFMGIIPTPVEISHTSEDGYFKYPLPTLYVEPSSIMDSNLEAGTNFTINIAVANVTDLYAWDFSLSWNPAILNVTGVTEGSFLQGAGSTVFMHERNQTEGYLHVNCSLTEPISGASGNGIMTAITFDVKARGQTYIYLALPRPSLPDLDETVLLDSEGVEIRHATENGFFTNLLRDIAVTKIEASPTAVKAGDSVTIDVTIRNGGYMNETSIDISVTTPSPPSPTYVLIGTQTILSLEPDQETTLTFTWDTTNVGKGEYTIRAEASTVPEETDTADNILDMTGTVEVTSPAEPIPTTYILAAIGVVAVISIAIFLYTRRKPSAE